MNTYRSLKDAVLDLDPLLIRTLGALSIETRPEGHLVLFRFMLYGQNLERETDVEQCPDVEVLLDRGLDPDEELRELEECEIVGRAQYDEDRVRVAGARVPAARGGWSRPTPARRANVSSGATRSGR